MALFVRGAIVLLATYATLATLRAQDVTVPPGLGVIVMIGGTLIVLACGVLALAMHRANLLRAERHELEGRVEALADENWQLKEAQEQTLGLIEALGDVVVRRDSNGHITYANAGFCQLADQGRDDIHGTDCGLTVREQGAFATLADGTRVHDQKVATATGARWIAWRDVRLPSESGRSEVLSVGRDVTDRTITEHALAEARDQAESANRAKSRFLAMVSHEIRTPLNGILGMADLLLDTNLSPAQETYARAVKTSGDALLSLIEEILDFSKIEAGKVDLDARPFCLAGMIEEAVELLAPRAQAKGIDIACYVDDRIPPCVVGDAARLRQVVLNLAGNAIKFTDRGGVAVIVEPGLWPEEIAFIVRDTGVGIAPEVLPRIFDEFEQGDGGTTRRFGGTGLGLTISKRILDRMGGRIGATSQVGVGSTFYFSLRLNRAPSSSPEFTPPDLAGMSILIVTRSAIEAPLLVRRLGSWGASTYVVPDLEVANSLLPERPWDAVMVDRGDDAAAPRLPDDARRVAIRLMMITPGERRELPALMNLGYTGYLLKPLRAASLAARFAPSIPGQGKVPAAPVAQESDDHGIPLPGLAVLVAEDNEINALLARALLTRLGHRPTIASNGASALDAWFAARAAGTPYDLVLMDVQMPDIDGLEVTRRIRVAEAEAGNARTPIFALTANVFADDRDACLQAGMDGFLVKPLDRERLDAALDPSKRATTLAA
jgi:signal transduction histidine kinase/DNA-binding response OmpR family regulator